MSDNCSQSASKCSPALVRFQFGHGLRTLFSADRHRRRLWRARRVRRNQERIMNTVPNKKKLRASAIGAAAAVSLPTLLFAGAGTRRPKPIRPTSQTRMAASRLFMAVAG
jgi:hypothetical protein